MPCERRTSDRLRRANRIQQTSLPVRRRAFLILEQGKLAGVDWLNIARARFTPEPSSCNPASLDATIDLRPDQTAAHSSVVLSIAGEAPEAPKTRDLGQGSIYCRHDRQFREQAVARARVLNQPVSHVLATSLYRDSPTDVLVERVDGTDWTVTFHNKSYRVLTDEHGCMLSATLPEYGVVIERRTDFTVAQYPLWPPYAAPPDGAYLASDVSIHVPQGHTLAGTLTMPLHGKLVPLRC